MTLAHRILPLTDTVTPADQAAVAETMAGAYGSATAVYPLGGGAGLRYGVRPTEPGLGLSLARLNSLIDYPARDLTITVEAGMTIAELTKRLASEGQRLPVDVPQPGRATVGGAVAINPSGPRRHRWGTLRDYVIGLRAADGQGTPFSCGGRVVKNAAGYNLCRLMTGSLGTLAVITQVTLMIKPAPQTSAWAVCELPHVDAAEPPLAALVRTETLPSAVELLTGPAWKDDPALGPPSTSDAAHLAVGFEGSRAEVDWMLETIRREWQKIEVAAAGDVRSSAAERFWDRLREFPADDPDADDATPLVVAIRVPPSAVVGTIREAIRSDPGCSVQAHAGDGIVRVRFARAAEDAAEVLDGRLRSAVSAAGGSAVVTSCPGGCRLSRPTVWGPAVEDAGVTASIKRQFDPKGILNPGRFVY